MAIVYAVVAQQSLGELLVGSIFPGFLLSGLYISYILVRCYINPSLGPALPPEERVSTREKIRLLKNTIAPLLLIVLYRRDLRRYRDTGRGGRHRQFRRAVRVRAAPRRPQLAGCAGGRDCDAESDSDGDVDFLRRDDVRRLLHCERWARHSWRTRSSAPDCRLTAF